MDARVRALLEPQAFAKGAKTTNKKTNGGSTSKAPQSAQSSLEETAHPLQAAKPSRSIPVYDPKKLLNPRGARQSGTSQKSNLYLKDQKLDLESQMGESAVRPNHQHTQPLREDSGPRSMIEDLYGVQKRTESPAKRVKLDSDQEDVKGKGGGGSRTFRSSGIVGEYMKPNADELEQTVNHRKIVDLTNLDDAEDSDDDIKVVKARSLSNEQEVCYGCININVYAHAMPQPRKTTNLYGDLDSFPMTRCTVVRMPSKNTIIEVKDPHDFSFGRIEPETASIFAPLLDGLKKFRLELWLNPRKKRPNEIPHQRCSEKLAANITLYGRRIDVEKVGKILGQRNIWLRNPLLVGRGCETVNPHAERFRSVVPQSRSTARHNPYSETRTVEEATEAVTKLFDHYANTARPLLETNAGSMILTPLLPHQKQALTFMLQREMPRTYGEAESQNSSLWRKRRKANGLVIYEEIVTGIILKEEPEEVFGGLLADVMGLGKTLEALALIASTMEDATDYSSQPLRPADASESELMIQSKATLIVAPVSTVKNWEDQISEHIREGAISFYVYHGPNREKDFHKLARYDIIISTYSTIAAECSAKSQIISPIKAIKWFRIILDEAHTIRESRAIQSQAMYNLSAQRRWCLTGTPIQNRLDDLGSLTRFLRLYPYDTTMRFNQYVRSPAQSGDANYLKSLRVFIDSFTLRRLRDRVDLPPRKDLVEKLNFSTDEGQLHTFFKERASVQIQELAGEKKHRTISQHHVLRAIMTLRLICDHGRELLKEDDLEAFKGNSASEAIDVDASTRDGLPTITPRTAYDTLALLAEADLDLCKQCEKKISGDSPQSDFGTGDDVRGYMLPCFDLLCCDCFEEHRNMFDDIDDDQTLPCPACELQISAQYIPIPRTTAELLDWAPEETLDGENNGFQRGTYTGPSTKVRALLRDLDEIRAESEQLEARGEAPVKSVVFSEFTSYLDRIERALQDHGMGGCYGRIDGSMSLPKRKVVLDRLNHDASMTILLASIKAAGQGLNLTAASRAFIMEPMWNPASEAQAVDRIYRIGQHRNVVVKRYQMHESIEGQIIRLQQKKQALADVSMNKNHHLLNKRTSREDQMKEILSLFK